MSKHLYNMTIYETYHVNQKKKTDQMIMSVKFISANKKTLKIQHSINNIGEFLNYGNSAIYQIGKSKSL